MQRSTLLIWAAKNDERGTRRAASCSQTHAVNRKAYRAVQHLYLIWPILCTCCILFLSAPFRPSFIFALSPVAAPVVDGLVQRRCCDWLIRWSFHGHLLWIPVSLSSKYASTRPMQNQGRISGRLWCVFIHSLLFFSYRVCLSVSKLNKKMMLRRMLH